MRGKDFLTLEELSPAELRTILDLSKKFKTLRKRSVVKDVLRGRTVALLRGSLPPRASLSSTG